MGTDQVKEYCIELRNQVHLQTDILLEQVHQFNEAVIAEIDEYEKKCVDSYQQKSVRYQTANKKFLTKLKKFYNENSKYLTEFKMDEQKIQDGLVQTVKYLVELKKRGSWVEDAQVQRTFNQVYKECKQIGQEFVGFTW